MSGYCVKFDPTVGVGAVGPRVPQTLVRPQTWMNIDNNIKSRQDCSSTPIINPLPQVPQSGPLKENYYVNHTGRGEINPQSVEQVNISGNKVWHNLSFLDEQKTTTKETTEYAYVGNAQREEQASKFWTYDDKPLTTIKETTEYAYVGNAQREDQASKFWTYDDKPLTTVKETTEYAYAGNAQREGNAPKSYNQYTGFGDKSGGADTYSLRGATLVQNWMAPSGRQNLLGEAESRMGRFDAGTFGSDQNYDGPGTLERALPDASRSQYQYILGKQRISPNKLVGVDDRQLASYQIQKLKKNPLSVYRENDGGKIPGFGCDVKPDDFSAIKRVKSEGDVPKKDNFNTVDVYPTVMGNKQINPNSQMLDLNMGEYRSNSNPTFSGKCYSGENGIGWDEKGNPKTVDRITLGGTNEPGIGSLSQPVSREFPEMNVGMCNPNKPPTQGNKMVSFATNNVYNM